MNGSAFLAYVSQQLVPLLILQSMRLRIRMMGICPIVQAEQGASAPRQRCGRRLTRLVDRGHRLEGIAGAATAWIVGERGDPVAHP